MFLTGAKCQVSGLACQEWVYRSDRHPGGILGRPWLAKQRDPWREGNSGDYGRVVMEALTVSVEERWALKLGGFLF